MKQKEDFICPVCERKLFSQADLTGVNVWCGAPEQPRTDGYHCKEVHGRGKDGKTAFNVIEEKFEKALQHRKDYKR